MSRSKGERVQVCLRVSNGTREALQRLVVELGHDSLGSLVSELVALRADRDGELRRLRSLLEEAVGERDATLGLLRDQRRLMGRLRRVRGGRVPVSGLLELAARTRCVSCEFFMDAGGLRDGFVRCVACRGQK